MFTEAQAAAAVIVVFNRCEIKTGTLILDSSQEIALF